MIEVKKKGIRFAYRYYEIVAKTIKRVRRSKNNDEKLNLEFQYLRMLLGNMVEANSQLRMKKNYHGDSIPEQREVGFIFPKRTRLARKYTEAQKRVWTYTIKKNKKFHWTHGPLSSYICFPESKICYNDIEPFLNLLEAELVQKVTEERSMIMLSTEQVSRFCFSKIMNDPKQGYHEYETLDGVVYLTLEDLLRTIKYEKILSYYHIPFVAIDDPMGFDDVRDNIQTYLDSILIVSDNQEVIDYLFTNHYVPEGTKVVGEDQADEDNVFAKNVFGTLPIQLCELCHVYIPCTSEMIQEGAELKPYLIYKAE